MVCTRETSGSANEAVEIEVGLCYVKEGFICQNKAVFELVRPRTTQKRNAKKEMEEDSRQGIWNSYFRVVLCCKIK
jgi:hypothetical protein